MEYNNVEELIRLASQTLQNLSQQAWKKKWFVVGAGLLATYALYQTGRQI